MSKLIIIRGNSGSGKSTVARELQQRIGHGAALIEQDYLRRKLLQVKDTPGNPVVELINLNTRYALDQGYDTIVEGIFRKDTYEVMLRSLLDDYPNHFVYYFDIPFDETLRRHQTRSKTVEFGEAEMRRWWRDKDMLGTAGEFIFDETISQLSAVQTILDDISR